MCKQKDEILKLKCSSVCMMFITSFLIDLNITSGHWAIFEMGLAFGHPTPLTI